MVNLHLNGHEQKSKSSKVPLWELFSSCLKHHFYVDTQNANIVLGFTLSCFVEASFDIQSQEWKQIITIPAVFSRDIYVAQNKWCAAFNPLCRHYEMSLEETAKSNTVIQLHVITETVCMVTAKPRTLTRYKADLFHQKRGLPVLFVIVTHDIAQFLEAELTRFSFKTFKPLTV